MTIDKGIFIRNIYYMLTYAFQELKQNNYEEIAGEEFEEIHDLFAEILLRGISFQLKQGLHKEYISCHGSLSTLKGKLDICGTVNNLMRKQQKIDCEYDELSENNKFNQILKTTVQFLLKHPKVKSDRKAALKRLMLFFSDVEAVDILTIDWTTMRFDRNCKTYRMLLYVCYFILDGMLMTTERGAYKMKEFSDEHMCRLYEKFVLEYYRKHYPELKAKATQIDWNIDKEQSTSSILPIMRTDIMLTFKERTLIIDTKYYSRSMQSQFDKRTIHSNNLYQIHSYVMNYDTNHTGKVDGMLLYAKTEEDIASLETYEDKKMFLEELGLEQSGVNRLIKKAYALLNLETFITAGEMEVKAWTYHKGWKAPQCAGVIHTDFEKGFIRAEVIKYEDYIKYGSESAVREAGKLGIEGKDYVVQDGDIMHFRFNV